MKRALTVFCSLFLKKLMQAQNKTNTSIRKETMKYGLSRSRKISVAT